MPVLSTSVDKKNNLTVETGDLLQDVKKGAVKELLKIGKFQIRTEIPLGEGGNVMRAELLAKAEAVKIKKELEKDVEDLAKKVEKLLKEDATGNKKAAAEAEKLVKATEKNLKDALPEFGTKVRKAAEKGWEKKLAASQRSSSSGGFSGIELLAEFTAGDAEFVPHLKELAEGVEKLGKELAKKTTEESRSLTKYQETLEAYFASFKRAQSGENSLTAQKYREGAGKKDAEKVSTAGKDYEGQAESFQRELDKATKDLDKLDKFRKTIKDPDADTKVALRASDDFEKALEELSKTIAQRVDAMEDWRPNDILSDDRKWDNVKSKILKLDPAETRKLGGELEKAGTKFEQLAKRLSLS